MAAIKAQAQVAKMARSEETRNHAIDQVLTGAERAGRLVEQLLTLARLDSTARSLMQPTDLRKLAVEWSPTLPRLLWTSALVWS